MELLPYEIVVSHIVPHVTRHRQHLLRLLDRHLHEALPIQKCNVTKSKSEDSRFVQLIRRCRRVKVCSQGLAGVLVSVLSDKNQITEISFSENVHSDKNYRPFIDLLQRNKSLRSLSCREFPPADLPAQLEALRMRHYCGVETAAKQLIAHLSNPQCMITKLDLRDSTFSAAAAALIVSQSHHLTHLNLYGYTGLGAADMGHENFEPFCTALKQSKTLKHLDISYQQLTEDHARQIADVLKVNTTLTSLHFSGNTRLGSGEGLIWQALEKNTSLQEFVAEDCELADLDAVTKCFAQNTTLTSACILSGNMYPWKPVLDSMFALGRKPTKFTLGTLTDAGADVAKILNQRTNWLETLVYHSYSTVSKEQARHLRSLLSKAQNLHTFTLDVPDLDMECLTIICEGLEENKTLRTLKLSFVTEEALQCIGDALEASETIEIVKVAASEEDEPIFAQMEEEFPSITWRPVDYV
jgi:hypothetical protein